METSSIWCIRENRAEQSMFWSISHWAGHAGFWHFTNNSPSIFGVKTETYRLSKHSLTSLRRWLWILWWNDSITFPHGGWVNAISCHINHFISFHWCLILWDLNPEQGEHYLLEQTGTQCVSMLWRIGRHLRKEKNHWLKPLCVRGSKTIKCFFSCQVFCPFPVPFSRFCQMAFLLVVEEKFPFILLIPWPSRRLSSSIHGLSFCGQWQFLTSSRPEIIELFDRDSLKTKSTKAKIKLFLLQKSSFTAITEKSAQIAVASTCSPGGNICKINRKHVSIRRKGVKAHLIQFPLKNDYTNSEQPPSETFYFK